MDDHLKWKTIENREILKSPLFRILLSERKAKDGTQGVFHILEAPDWATIVPVIKNSDGVDCFLLVKQFRHGCEKITWEFPAGLIEKGEKPEIAAARELREETGYTAGSVTFIGKTHPLAAFMTNSSYTFFTDNCIPDGKQELDLAEILDVIVIPVSEAEDMIRRGADEFSNSQTIISYHFWKNYCESRKTPD